MAKHHIEATVNGDAVEFLCETEEALLDVLRDTLNMTGSITNSGGGSASGSGNINTTISAVIGTNAFQVRRSPISVGLLDEDQVKAISKRPIISADDAGAVRRAVPEAQAVSLQSGWPTPVSDVIYRNRTVGNVLVFGVTPPFQIVQDYRFYAGDPLTEPDVQERRPVAVLGYDVAEDLGLAGTTGRGVYVVDAAAGRLLYGLRSPRTTNSS